MARVSVLPRRSRFLPPWQMPPALAGILAVVRLLPDASGPLSLLLLVGVVAATALPLLLTILTGVLVGSVPAAVRSGLDSPAGRHTLMLLGLAAVVIVLSRILTPVVVACANVLGREVNRILQERAMAAVARPVGIGHLEDPEVLDLITTAQGVGTQGITPGDGIVALASLLPSWLGVIGSAVILATFRWWLGLGWIALWPVVLYYLQREYIRVGQTASGQAAVVRRADYYRDLALTPEAAKELRLWGLTDWLTGRFRTAWQSAMSPLWDARRPGRAVLWGSAGIVVVADLLAFGLLASAAVNGDLSLAAVAVYTRAIIDASTFRAFDDANMELAYAAVSVPALLALEQRLGGQTELAHTALPSGSPRTEVRFEGVRFRYPNAADDAVAALDLSIPAGKSLAIVGANGAGKTTIVKLLCRMYEPVDGRITVDGVDLAEIDPAAWRERVAAIFQDFTHYHLSARENVAMGAPNRAGDEQRLREAAVRAGALDLVEALPHGWDTILSREYEGGVDLSGGQWQRIALARALFAVEAGARVLILDEPTANLDVRAEAELYDRFLEITEGLTTVLISHRFSTVRRAHTIVVLEGGRIAERGSHDELMALGGTYARLFRLQAERFVEGNGRDG